MNKSEMPPEKKSRATSVGTISCENHSLLRAFPFGFTLDQSVSIVGTGRALRRLAPTLVGKNFSESVNIIRPAVSSTLENLMELADTLCCLSLVEFEIPLRGEFIFHEDTYLATFVGTVNAATYEDLKSFNILKADLPKHDMLLDLVVFTQAHLQHAAELKSLNAQLIKEKVLREKHQAAEHSIARQLSLAADLRLVIENTRVVEYHANRVAGRMINRKYKFTPDVNTRIDAELFDFIPVLSTVDGLELFLRQQQKSFSFDFVNNISNDQSVFEGQCEKLEDGTVLVLIRDITKQRKLQKDLEFRANYDQLTGLANRDVLFRELSKIYESAGQLDVDQSYLVVIDLDNFKTVNDILGHAAGDRLLQIAANRIKESVRKGDLVTRLGGDEFAVIIRDVVSDDDDLEPLLDRLKQYMSADVDLRGFAWSPESSMGVAPLSSANSATEIMKNADLTMYDAKRAGKAKIHRFSNALKDQTVDDIKIQHRLKQAIKNDQLSVVFQPIFNLSRKSVVALEALARWHDSELGQVAPDRFIALAEKSDLIIALTEWMLQKSTLTHAQLKRDNVINDNMLMHVNVSPSVFRIGEFHERVKRTLQQCHMRPDRLVLEMTESVIVHDEESVRDQLNALSDLGIKLAIDDFGKGYSSLGYLEAYPFDLLKIDRKFVSQLHKRAVPYRLSTAIISLASALELNVIAEGIEVVGELNALVEMGCKMGQGYYLARPVSLDEIGQVLSEYEVVA